MRLKLLMLVFLIYDCSLLVIFLFELMIVGFSLLIVLWCLKLLMVYLCLRLVFFFRCCSMDWIVFDLMFLIGLFLVYCERLMFIYFDMNVSVFFGFV